MQTVFSIRVIANEGTVRRNHVIGNHTKSSRLSERPGGVWAAHRQNRRFRNLPFVKRMTLGTQKLGLVEIPLRRFPIAF